MFFEKFSRFLRTYDLSFAARHKGGVDLPVIGPEGMPNVHEALKLAISEGRAFEHQANKDLVELLVSKPYPDANLLVLLFHKASPNAADPTYRRKGKAGVTVRHATKQPDEDQAVSAHMVINTRQIKKGVYRAVLEEIPGLSMGILKPIIGHALAQYKYPFADIRGKREETHAIFHPEGVKSATITGALKDGRLNFITLTRPAKPDFVDAEGIFQPINETMKIRIVDGVNSQTWGEMFTRLKARAKDDGWQDFNIEIDMGKRTRTVKLERDQEAKEVLFVRSEEVYFDKPLSVCTTSVVDQLVEKAKSYVINIASDK